MPEIDGNKKVTLEELKLVHEVLNANINEVRASNFIGSFSTLAQLSALLDSELSSMDAATVRTISCKATTTADPFLGDVYYRGILYKSGTSTIYSGAILCPMGKMRPIHCCRGDTGWSYNKLEWYEEYKTVSNWDNFKPNASFALRHGVSINGSATGVPIAGDNISYRGYVEGASENYCVQHITVSYADTLTNRSRMFVRLCIGGTWTSWREILCTNDVVDSLSSTATDRPLSAAKGKALQDGKAADIYFSSTYNTWGKVFALLDTIPTLHSATFFADAAVATILTNAKVTNTTFKGTIHRASSDMFDIIASTGLGNYLYCWRISNATSSSGTVGTVYKYTGTAI